MSQKKERRIGSFQATGNNGRQIIIDEYQEFIINANRDGNREVPGIKSLTTRDGQHVNRIDQGSYEIAATGERLTSTDPKAP